jgi:hypothetical protein
MQITPELNAPMMEILMTPMRTFANHSGCWPEKIKPLNRLAKKRIVKQLQMISALPDILAYRSDLVGIIFVLRTQPNVTGEPRRRLARAVHQHGS